MEQCYEEACDADFDDTSWQDLLRNSRMREDQDLPAAATENEDLSDCEVDLSKDEPEPPTGHKLLMSMGTMTENMDLPE